MRKTLPLALLGLFLAGAAHTQEAGLLPLTSALGAASSAVSELNRTRRFELEYGPRGARWTLNPNTSPPGSSLRIDVEQGDTVVLHLVKYVYPRMNPETSVDLDGVAATVDGRPSNGVHILMRDFGSEEHTASFVAEKEGALYLYSRWGRPGHWGVIFVRKKKT